MSASIKNAAGLIPGDGSWKGIHPGQALITIVRKSTGKPQPGFEPVNLWDWLPHQSKTVASDGVWVFHTWWSAGPGNLTRFALMGV